jgi:serine O-acetyltransferase
VPENSVVVGVPGQIVTRSKPHKASDAPDLNHTHLPDLIGVTLTTLMSRVEVLESRLNGHETTLPQPHLTEAGTWDGTDFSI